MAHPPRAPRSYAFENAVFALVIPAAVLLVPWVWFGRSFLGAGGWFLLFFAFTVVPALVITLGLTTVLAFTQRRPQATGRLTARQAWAHVLTWVALAALGFFVVDFGDTEDSANSILTVVMGNSPALRDLSMAMAVGAGSIACLAWLWLLVELILGNRETRRRRASAAQQQWQGSQVTAPPPPRVH
jgi:hypothetical protein